MKRRRSVLGRRFTVGSAARPVARLIWVSTWIAAVVAHAQSPFEWVVDKGVISFTGARPEGELIIPPAVNGSPVTSIRDSAFSDCSRLTRVTLPTGVARIGTNAFNRCAKLTNVVLPDSVTQIGAAAFKSCASLRSVSVPISVPAIEDWVFYECDRLKSVIIPNGVMSIGAHAFAGCSSLTTVTIPATVTNIGNYSFAGCASLTDLCCQGNAPYEGNEAFVGAGQAVVRYLSGTTGWGPEFGRAPTELWTHPVISAGSAEVVGNAFTFRISWAPNARVAVEGCVDLAKGYWTTLEIRASADGSWLFSDPYWATQSKRFYRVLLP